MPAAKTSALPQPSLLLLLLHKTPVPDHSLAHEHRRSSHVAEQGPTTLRDSWCRWGGRGGNKMLQKRSRTNKFKLLPEGLGRRVFGLGRAVLGVGWSCLLCLPHSMNTHNDPHAVAAVCTPWCVLFIALHCKNLLHKNLKYKALHH